MRRVFYTGFMPGAPVDRADVALGRPCSGAVEQEPEPAGIGDDQHRVYQQERTQIRLQATPREDDTGDECEKDSADQARHPGRPISTPEVDYRGAAQAGIGHVLPLLPAVVYEKGRSQ